MTADLRDLLVRLEAATAAATPGPWELAAPRELHDVDGGGVAHQIWNGGGGVGETWEPADAALIVAAVNALPVLVAELRRHQAAVQAVLQVADSMKDGSDLAVEDARRIRAAVAALDPKEQDQ